MSLTNLLPIFIFAFFYLFAWTATKNRAQEPQNNESRYDYIDGIRGIAAILVIATHFWRITPAAQGVSFLFEGKNNYGPLGVQIFFCITGFLFFGQMITKDMKFSWDSFYRSRIRRIIPAYCAYLILGLCAVMAYGDISKAEPAQLKNLADLAFMGFAGNGSGKIFAGVHLDIIFGVIWTLKYEALFYIAFPFIVYIVGRLSILRGFTFLFLVTIYELISTGETLCGYFLTGGLAFIIAKKRSENKYLRIALYGVAILLVTNLLASNYPDFGWIRYILTSSLFIILTICRPSFLTSKPLTYLGDISYSLYLVHAPILILNRVFWAKIIELNSYDTTLYLIITFLGVLSIFTYSALQYKYIELPFLTKPQPNKLDTTFELQHKQNM